MKLTVFIILTIVLGMFVFDGCGQRNEFRKWDENDNGTISKKEFIDNFTDSYFEKWDYNHDNKLDAEDYYHTTFNILDVDGDGHLSQSEWDWGRVYLFHGYHLKRSIKNYDLNHNNYLEFNEYRTIVSGIHFLPSFELNEEDSYSKSELAQAVFKTWDLDGNGKISRSEFDTFYNYYFHF